MKLLVEVFVSIRQKIEALAVVFKNLDVTLIPHIPGVLEHFVRGLLLLSQHRVIAFLDKISEAGYLPDVGRVGLVFLVPVGCNP